VRIEFGKEKPPEFVERLPFYLNPASSLTWCANFLIEQGHAILIRIPQRPAPSPLAENLITANPLVPEHARAVTYWVQDVSTFLAVRAPQCQALFRMRERIPMNSYGALREYMQKRIDELKVIHGRLSD
jgi:hypothetical protein